MSLSGGMGGGAVTASDAPGQVLTFGWKRGTPHQEVAPVDERRIYDKLGERQDARRAKDFDLESFDEVYTSRHWLMRVYRVRPLPNRGGGLAARDLYN